MKGLIMRWFGRTAPGGLDCHQVGEVLQHYLDGEIDDHRARQIEAHLEDCRRCGLEADMYAEIKASLAARRPDVPTESVDRLREFGERLARGDDPTVEHTE